MTTCAMCGDCCRAIRLDHTKADVRRIVAAGPQNPDGAAVAGLILAHWHRVSRAEAERRLPGFVRSWDKAGRFYTCDLFDPATNRCTWPDHDTLPRICKGFPWYEGGAEAAASGELRLHRAFARCSFWADVPVPAWPPGCDPLPSGPPHLIQIHRKDHP